LAEIAKGLFLFRGLADECRLAETETRRAYCRLEGSDQLALFAIAEG
jgi:hypothetical protein